MSQVISITLRSLCLVRGVWIDSVTSDHFRQSLSIIEPSLPLQMIENYSKIIPKSGLLKQWLKTAEFMLAYLDCSLFSS